MRFIIRIICLWLKYVQKRRVWIWLDDLRPMPRGFDIHAATAKEAIALLKTGKVGHISLDHDLGADHNGTGYDVAKFIETMAFFGKLPRLTCAIHSANPVGRKNMTAALVGANRWWANEESV